MNSRRVVLGLPLVVGAWLALVPSASFAAGGRVVESRAAQSPLPAAPDSVFAAWDSMQEQPPAEANPRKRSARPRPMPNQDENKQRPQRRTPPRRQPESQEPAKENQEGDTPQPNEGQGPAPQSGDQPKTEENQPAENEQQRGRRPARGQQEGGEEEAEAGGEAEQKEVQVPDDVHERLQELLRKRRERAAAREAAQEQRRDELEGQTGETPPGETPPGEAQPGETPPGETPPGEEQPSEQIGEPPVEGQPESEQEPVLEQQPEGQQPEQGGEDPSTVAQRRRVPERPNQVHVDPRHQAQQESDEPAVTMEAPADSEKGEINIEPNGEANDVPPEQRQYSFSIKDGMYEQLLSGVARQTGLGVLGDAPRDGKVTFVTEETLTFDEMLRRVRMLLFNYKTHDPYWLWRKETHLQVVRVADAWRELPPERMYRSLEEYQEANLPEEELAMVIFTPKSGSIAQLSILRDFLPDYVRVAPLGDSNSITISALVRDINKYFQLKEILVLEGNDPRTLTVIEVKHILPSEAWNQLQVLINFEAESASAGTKADPGRPDGTGLETMPEPPVSVVPDDNQGVLLVRAMQDKIDEIKALLPFIDKDTSGAVYPPEVIKLEHETADALIPVIQQVFTATYGTSDPSTGQPAQQRRRPRRSSARRGGSAGGTETATMDSVTLIAHPANDAIIVIAAPEDVEQVRKLVREFDVERSVGPEFIPVEFTDAAELATMLTQVVGGSPQPGMASSLKITPSPSGDGIFFTGTIDQKQTVMDIVKRIDVGAGGVTLHVYKLEHQLPTFVASILQQFDQAGGVLSDTSSTSSTRRRRPRRNVKANITGAPGKFTPDDEQMRLFVLCTDDEWTEYKRIIEELEAQVDEPPPSYVTLPVEHIAPADAVDRLQKLIGPNTVGRPGQPAAGELKFEPGDGAVIVVGATDEQLKQARELLEVFDRPINIIQRTFTIEHADPATLVAGLEAIIIKGEETSGGRTGRRPADPNQPVTTMGTDVTIFPMDNLLVVKAPPKKMDQIAEFINEFDVPSRETQLRVFGDFPPTADVEAIAETLRALLTGEIADTRPRQPGKPDATTVSEKLKIIPQADAGRIIVVAEPSRFEEIEHLLDVLRPEGAVEEIVIESIALEFADPEEAVAYLEPLLVVKVQQLMKAGTIPTETTATPTAAGQPRSSRRARGNGEDTPFHLSADLRNRRVVIAATQPIVDEARKLVEEFDQKQEGEETIDRMVQLNNAPAEEVVRSVRELAGSATQRMSGRRQPSGSAGNVAGTQLEDVQFIISAAPGNRAVVMRGPKDLVEQATKWIEQMDQLPAQGRIIKAYSFDEVNVSDVLDLILAAVDVPQAARSDRPRSPRGRDGEEEEEDPWATKIKRTAGDVYVEADTISNSLVVAATPAKIVMIDSIVDQLKKESTEDGGPIGVSAKVPKFTYELKHKDPLDAAFELEGVLEQLWDEKDTPKVESALFGDFLIIEYPHEEHFPKIVEMIEKYVDKEPDDKPEVVRITRVAPKGMSAEDVANLIMLNNPQYEFELENKATRADVEFPVERVKPATTEKGTNECVLPGAWTRMTNALRVTSASLAFELAQSPRDEGPADDEQDEAQDDLDNTADYLGDVSNELMQEDQVPETKKDVDSEPSEAKPVPAEGEPRQKVRVYYDSERGALIIEGPQEAIDDVESTLEDIEEEMEKFQSPPDIRIFRLKYIDVYTAENIINEMFNQTRADRQSEMMMQRQMQLQRQRQLQQLRRQQQLQAQRAAQGQGAQQQPGRGGEEDEEGGDEDQSGLLSQGPPTAVRVYPNPRDRTLIVRAEPSQYPALLELISTIDQPQPIESEFRTFYIKKLRASEVEQMLNNFLGLDGGEETRSSRRRAMRGGDDGGSDGGSLPRTIEQKITGSENILSVDPDDISITSNDDANTILAMAPPAALEYIANLIEEFESANVPERIWRNYELKHASAVDIVDYLNSRYGEGSESATRRRRQEPDAGSSGATPTFLAYGRLNMVSANATEEQIKEIDEVIARLDMAGTDADWRSLSLTHADAAHVATTLNDMFGMSGAARGGRGPGREADTAGPRFLGDEGGKVVFYQAPESLDEGIAKTVKEMEDQAAQQVSPRVIVLEHAEPSKLAEAIKSAYGEGRGGRRGGASATTVSVSAHDPSNRLFVIADDETFAEIESLVKSMDEPSKPDFDVRVYPLKVADAQKIYDHLNNLLTDYFRQLRGGGGGVDPFSVEVDQKTNSLIVLGSPSVFGFLEEKLPLLDVPANAKSPPGTLMVTMKNADATEVAANINRLWNERTMPAGEKPPTAEANRGTNTLIVRGTQAQVDEIKKEFVDPLEETVQPKLRTEIFTLNHAQPDLVADSINQIFEDRQRAMNNLRDTTMSPLTYTVVATADVSTNQVIVQASEENLELITARIAELDKPENAGVRAVEMRIYGVKYADPNAVAQIVKQWSQSRTSGGRQRTLAPSDVVEAVAEPATQSVVVTASESNHQIVKELIDGLDSESVAARQRSRHVLPLEHAVATEVAEQLTQVFRQTSRQRGDQGPGFVADANTNAIVATVNEEELAEVKGLLTSFDKETPADAERQVEVYAVEYADPNSISGAIQNMFRGDRRGALPPSEQVDSAVDAGTRSVIVTASAKNHEIIRKMIEKADVESARAMETFVVKIENGSAETIAETLQQVYGGRRATGRGEQPVQISASNESNSLVVTAKPDEMEKNIRPLIQSLDVEPAMDHLRKITAMALKHADPGAVQEAINELFRSGGRDPRDQVTAVPEWGSNSVIVSASPQNMQRVEELIANLDQAEGSQKDVHVVTLTNADPMSVTQTLTEIFIRSAPQRRGGGEQPISISALQGSKAVLVKASQQDFEEISRVIEQLDTEESVGGDSRVIALKHGDATEVSRALQETLRKPGGRGNELIGDVRISAMAQGNTLLVSGTKEDLDRIAEQVAQMDEAGAASSQPKMIKLVNARPQQVLPTLREMFTEQPGGGRRNADPPVITALEQTNAILVRADAQDMAAIESVISQLDMPELAEKPGQRVVQIKQGVNVVELAEMIQEAVNEGQEAQLGGSGGRGGRGGSDVPQITVTPDTRTNSMIIAGSPMLFDEAEGLARQMEGLGPAGGLVTTSFPIKNVELEEVKLLIDQLTSHSGGGDDSGRSRSSGRTPTRTNRRNR